MVIFACGPQYNIKLARERMLKNQGLGNKPEIDIGNLVLVKDHTLKSFQLRFQSSLHQRKLQSILHITNVRKMTIAEKVIEIFPDY